MTADIFVSVRAGVREKVYWMPDKLTWGLKFKGDAGVDKEYCRRHDVTLTISSALGTDFTAAREKAFRNACIVWNAVDMSGKQRISIIDPQVDGEMLLHGHKKAMSHEGSGSESESFDEVEEVIASAMPE